MKKFLVIFISIILIIGGIVAVGVFTMPSSSETNLPQSTESTTDELTNADRGSSTGEVINNGSTTGETTEEAKTEAENIMTGLIDSEGRPIINNNNTSDKHDNKMYNKDGVQVHIIMNADGVILKSPYLSQAMKDEFAKQGINETAANVDTFCYMYFIDSAYLDNTTVHQDLVEKIVDEMAQQQKDYEDALAGEYVDPSIEGEAPELVGDTPQVEVETPAQKEYAVEDRNETLYSKGDINIRKGPSTDFEVAGSLTLNQEVKVTGYCAETDWYRLEVNGQEVFASGKYLVSSPIHPQGGSTGSQESQGGNSGSTGNPFADNKGQDPGENTGASMDWSNNY